jgi:hypothetical protein
LGFGLGADIYLQVASPRNPLRLRAQYTTETWQKFTGGTILNRGGKWELHVGGGYKYRPNLEYYGIGPNTSVEDAAFYKDERAWGGANFRRRLPRKMMLAFTGVYSSIGATQPDSDYEPSMVDVYGDDLPPGFGRRSDGVMMRVSWVFNTTKEEGNPDRGTILAVSIGGFVATDNKDISFTAYRFEAQQFVPLWYSKRALALRGYLNFIDDTGTEAIPFQRMFINEAPDVFRGYDSGRWRDLGITGINAEYRYPFVADRKDGGFGIDVVALADIGQVYGEISEVRVDNLTQSYGLGLRMYMDKFFAGAVQFVWSDEGFQFLLSTKQPFQYSRDVLFQGREETLIH